MTTESARRDPARTRDSRERILGAAAQILGEEGMAARLSVRKVAQRAEVSAGSLRHHFPSQQDLRDEVVRRIYDWVAADTDIYDVSVPPRERLVGCLRTVMSTAEVGRPAREALLTLTETFIAAEPSEAVRESYLAMEQDGQRRVEKWLRVLADEGHLPHGRIAARARFLNTVLEGLMLKRALPASDAIVEIEDETLDLAVGTVLS